MPGQPHWFVAINEQTKINNLSQCTNKRFDGSENFMKGCREGTGN